MSTVLFVSPMVDEKEDEEIQKQDQEILSDLNRILSEKGLSNYSDPKELPQDYQYWNFGFNTSLFITFHDFVKIFKKEINLQIPHFIDPFGKGVRYFPVDFPEPILSNVHEGMIYGSCQGLMRDILTLGKALDIPLERFPIDFSFEGEDQGEEWMKVISELREKGAHCMQLRWAEPTEESLRNEIKRYNKMMGLPDNSDNFMQAMVKQYGSMENFIECTKRQGPSNDETCAFVVICMVNYYHGCSHALKYNLTFGIG